MKKIETRIGDVIVEAAKLELMFGYSHVVTALYKEVETGEPSIICFPINHRKDIETILNSDDILTDAFDALKEEITDRINRSLDQHNRYYIQPHYSDPWDFLVMDKTNHINCSFEVNNFTNNHEFGASEEIKENPILYSKLKNELSDWLLRDHPDKAL